MLFKGAQKRTPMGCSLLIVGILLYSLIGTSHGISSDVAETGGGTLKIEGGWSEVTEGWPLDAVDYFLATEKGHHFVESQDLPANLKYDLEVTFEYYYSYSKTKPVLQMTPCTNNVFIDIKNGSSEDRNKNWHTHNYRVDREKCLERNEIAYNVLLHDPGDVFAWKMLKIESIIPPSPVDPTTYLTTETSMTETTEPTTPAETHGPTTKDDIANMIDDEIKQTPELQDKLGSERFRDVLIEAMKRQDELRAQQSKTEPTTQAPTTLRPAPVQTKQLGPPQAMIPVTQPRVNKDGKTRDYGPSDLDAMQDYLTQRRTYPGSPAEKNTEAPPPPTTTTTTMRPVDILLPDALPDAEVRTTLRPQLPSEEDIPKRKEPAEAHIGPAAEDKTSGDKRPSPDDDQIDAGLNQRRRRKRAAPSGQSDSDQEGGLVNEICIPSACNKQKFKMARFSALTKGLPKRKRKSLPGKYLVNLNNKPLAMEIESREESLAEVDTCVSLLLYMEAGTELELSLGAEAGPPGAADQRDRLLELIKRKTGDSTAGRWDEFSRCISDYMPEYKPKRTMGNGKVHEDNSMRLIMRPKGAQQPGQVAVVIPDEACYLRRLYRKQSFLPDTKSLKNVKDFDQYWIVDRDGLGKAKLSQTSALANASKSASTDGNGEKVLQIANIDPTQESFDLTSRWLQIKDAETLELPIQFVYKAEQADWIEQVDFQFQRSNAAADEWISQVAYKVPIAQGETPSKAGSTEAPTTKTAADQQPTIGSNKTALSGSQAGDTRPKTIELPIELKGLDSSEFRLRLRHHMKRTLDSKQKSGRNTSHALSIKSLAFADACSYGRPFCRHDGECKPTGPAQAECLCPQGYSGRFCEHVRPCEVLYKASDGKPLTTGDELCRSVGARCIDQLPELRCEWPDDKYYQCKKLFKLDASGQGYTPIHLSPRPAPGSSPQLPVEKVESGGQKPGDAQTGVGVGGGSEQPVELDDEAQLREKLDKSQAVVSQQAQLIIILSVFVVAILVFAIVLVGSMVGRLRKSSRRLKKAQGEVHELSRRAIHPGGFGGSMARPVASTSASGAPRPGNSGFNRNKNSGSPAGGSGYNNSAFDVES